MSPLQRVSITLLFVLLAVTIGQWFTHPVRRDQITPTSLNHRINVNTADVPTLSLLSGISTKISEYIIEERLKNGPFRSPEDLDRVERIGPVTIQKITPFISFE